MPLSGGSSEFALHIGGPGAESLWRRSVSLQTVSGVLSASGRELTEEDFPTPLSDAGVSADCVVELLRVPPLPPAAAGAAGSPVAAALAIYVDASRFGMTDLICVELHPDATVDLVAAAADSLGLRVRARV
eukprot:TRINITY_DN29410_c0_g1_i1.p2 TRINITY_DN29410_c0_g1~~TRINITY_DN29410_c0_g1_i1.p2  ORF type:complete len:131 (+),score=17.42 TRINITY_DN29410_c0_g1_i1:715-1107(+)